MYKFLQEVSINFSIVLPSIRWEWIATVLDSIFDNAYNKELIEAHILVNLKDFSTQKVLNDYSKKNFNVFMHLEDEKNFMIEGANFVCITPCINYLSFQFSRGKYIIPMNDDALFVSKDWDIKAYKKLEETNSDNILGITKDNINAAGFNSSQAPACSFPIISRKGAEYFGFVYSPLFRHSTADTHICWLYWSLAKVVDLKDEVEILHRPKELCNLIPPEL